MPAGAQPVGPAQESRRLERRRRRRRGGRLWPAAPGHRHRRLDPAAGRLVRRGRPQAEPRTCADQAAVCRPRRRADDAHASTTPRCMMARAARPDCARRDEPAAAADRLARPRPLELSRPARRPACSTPAGAWPSSPTCARAVEAAARAFERAGAIVEPLAPFTTRAMVDGLDRFWRMRSWVDMQALPPERQAPGAALHPRTGSRGGARR